MKPNRSIPTATVIPVLVYWDVNAAVEFLGRAFGFRARVLIGPNHRAQLTVGEEGAVIVADTTNGRAAPAGEASCSVMVRVDDARAHCEVARAAGATILMAPTDMPFGERQYTATDIAGHVWTFSETIDDIAPEMWGGVTV